MGDGPEVNRLDFETMSRALEKCGMIIRERDAGLKNSPERLGKPWMRVRRWHRWRRC